jgi:ABC-type multidrug transport system fused ATPase/permease subunit
MSLSNGDNENTPWDRQIEIKNRYKKMNSTEHDISTTSAVGVRLEGIDLSFGKTHVLKGINLQIEPGEFFAFLGPSGCGKTTLLRLIAGFESAQAGRVIIGDREVSHLPPWRRNLGMVFQSYALWPHMTVYKNVAFGLEERHVPRNEIKERVEKTLDLVGLLDLAGRRPSQLVTATATQTVPDHHFRYPRPGGIQHYRRPHCRDQRWCRAADRYAHETLRSTRQSVCSQFFRRCQRG